MLRKAILASALTLVFAVGARADYFTTQVTLKAPYGGSSDINAVVNKGGALGSGLSYTASTGVVGTPVYATGAVLLGTFKEFNGTTGSFQTAAISETFGLTGTVIPPVGGAAFSAMFTSGTVSIYAVPLNSFNTQDETTWGPDTAGSTLLYSETVAAPLATHQGSTGDPAYNGQPAQGQNQASFFPASGSAALGALVGTTTFNNDALFGPPMPFSGFQDAISETNSLTGNYPSSGFPTNGQLDSNWQKLTGSALTPFTTLMYTQTANVNGPNTLQEIAVTQYPVIFIPSPEPASILLLSFGAIGFGFYARRQQKKGVPV